MAKFAVQGTAQDAMYASMGKSPKEVSGSTTLGISLTSGVIAGVALKDVVSGIFAGAAVNFEKTFQIGDLVTISNIKGTVEDISMLTTKLRTENGETVYVPNQLIFNTPFINHSKKS